MIKLKGIKLWCLGIAIGSVGAMAAEPAAMKGLSWNGNAEAGYFYSFHGTPTQNDSGFFVDALRMNMTAQISDKTKIVVNNAMAVNHGGQDTYPLNMNSAAYFSSAVITGGVGNNLVFANNGAYIDHKLSEGMHLQVGHLGVPFGMETMWDRYDMHTYYYTGLMTVLANNSGATNGTDGPGVGWGWMYDLGIKLNLTEVIPGSLEIALLEGIAAAPATSASGGAPSRGDNTISPAASVRYTYELKQGDISITPVLSAYAGRMVGSPRDLGFSAGGQVKAGALWANVEFLYASRNTNYHDDNKTTMWSVWAEPGFDLGMATVSAKVEYFNTKTGPTASNVNDFNVGAAISHTYEGGYRIKLAYAHVGVQGDYPTVVGGTSGHYNDVRLLLSAKF